MKITIEQEEYLRNNYLLKPVKTMGKELGHNYGWVKTRLDFLGLIIPKDIIQRNKSMSLFKKGQKAHNKGKKHSDYMDYETIEKIKKTQFKKGNIPHNAKLDGEESIILETSGRKYTLIKRKGCRKLVLKQRVIYEENFGKIRKGYTVVFKDGNTDNFDPSNLKSISRQELMLLNSTKHNYPQELIPVHAKIAEIKKKLTNKNL